MTWRISRLFFVSVIITVFVFSIIQNFFVLRIVNLDYEYFRNSISIKDGIPVLSLNAKIKLLSKSGWIQFIDNNGNEIASINKPHALPNFYAENNTDYIKNKIKTLVNQNIMIQDYETAYTNKTTIKFKYIIGAPYSIYFYPSYDIFYSYLTDWSTAKILATLITITALAFVSYIFGRKFAIAFKDISDGINNLIDGNYCTYTEKGMFREFYNKLNEAANSLQASKAAQANTDNVKKQQIINVTFELKSSISAIKAYTELIAEVAEVQANMEVRPGNEYTKTIISKCNDMDILIDELVDDVIKKELTV